ncbi:protein serine/threonine phosphatase 2C [Fistulina hepatica ATCC 64428]|uniref:Protein serine/threonine phosphatase 2C n=1 Tax=Fistulina hepatica ATCC 64428 TaxID=1128425 RepID=A0A0D7ANJ0_9AGAR|nr:protein serine/threonine phosphatase 2C [Fistulina hepatica ATCC 64428]
MSLNNIESKRAVFTHPITGGSFYYTLLTASEVDARLPSLFSSCGSSEETDYVSFQPDTRLKSATQDRFVVTDIELSDGSWKLRAVLDGHGGHDAVNFASQSIAAFLRSRLNDVIDAHDNSPPADAVARAIVDAVRDMDNSIADGLYALFPGGEQSLSSMTNEEISAIVNDAPENHQKVMRCVNGSTLLLSLIDARRENLWVCSLGDCQAVLCQEAESGQWSSSVLSFNHNAGDPGEAARLKSEHPGEEEIILNDRVLGVIAITRAIGDYEFKLSLPYVQRVLLNIKPSLKFSFATLEQFISRLKTPPYLTSQSEVTHVSLNSLSGNVILVLCSDGLIDAYEEGSRDLDAFASRIATALRDVPPGSNIASHLIRDAIGGADLEKASYSLTLEFPGKWLDDVTVLVQRL